MVGEDSGVGDDSDLWHSMSADLQKGAKLSDKIIRTMTAFLSGVGGAIKVSAPGAGAVGLTSSGTFPDAIMVTSPQTDSSGATATMVASNSHPHSSRLRAMSLDDEAVSMQRELAHHQSAGRRRDSGKGSETSSNHGRSRLVRQSVDIRCSGRRQSEADFSRHRLDSKSREQPIFGTRDHISRISDLTEMGEERRVGTVASGSRSSAGRSANGRERLERDHETPPALIGRGAKTISGAVTGVRRLFSTCRPQTSHAVTRSDLVVRTRAMDDRGSPEDDHSPTPAERNGLANGKFPGTASARGFPPLAIPPPLSTVPSAANIQRMSTTRFATASASSASSSNGVSRRKTSTGSTTTLRGGGARFLSLTSPSQPTTQITTATVSTASEWDSQ
ncbi:hypothetical protein FRB98_001893 [Tulasnella sp. 332]|nr:hypothetical protein FRB98_001893 [Tulasnella sp. 332]